MKTAKLTNLFLFIILAVFFVGCQTPPTKVYEQSPAELARTSIILDARPSFEYMSSHIPGSINVNWEDFSVPEKNRRGELKSDLSKEARRLALYGISPDSSVIVVGNGVAGEGAEGRLAWTLKYLGVKNVRAMPISRFPIPMTAAESPPAKNADFWKPNYDESLLLTRKNFLAETKKIPRTALLLDVREEKEYLRNDVIAALNIPWKNFVNADGSANAAMTTQLESLGHAKNKLIIVVSNTGVRSAYVTLLLRELGFQNATNFAGGYQSLQQGR